LVGRHSSKGENIGRTKKGGEHLPFGRPLSIAGTQFPKNGVSSFSNPIFWGSKFLAKDFWGPRRPRPKGKSPAQIGFQFRHSLTTACEPVSVSPRQVQTFSGGGGRSRKGQTSYTEECANFRRANERLRRSAVTVLNTQGNTVGHALQQACFTHTGQSHYAA